MGAKVSYSQQTHDFQFGGSYISRGDYPSIGEPVCRRRIQLILGFLSWKDLSLRLGSTPFTVPGHHVQLYCAFGKRIPHAGRGGLLGERRSFHGDSACPDYWRQMTFEQMTANVRNHIYALAGTYSSQIAPWMISEENIQNCLGLTWPQKMQVHDTFMDGLRAGFPGAQNLVTGVAMPYGWQQAHSTILRVWPGASLCPLSQHAGEWPSRLGHDRAGVLSLWRGDGAAVQCSARMVAGGHGPKPRFLCLVRSPDLRGGVSGALHAGTVVLVVASALGSPDPGRVRGKVLYAGFQQTGRPGYPVVHRVERQQQLYQERGIVRRQLPAQARLLRIEGSHPIQTTSGSTTTNAQGQAEIVGFAGDYLLQIVAPGDAAPDIKTHVYEQKDLAQTIAYQGLPAVAVVSAASFAPGPVVLDSIAAIFGTRLATGVAQVVRGFRCRVAARDHRSDPRFEGRGLRSAAVLGFARTGQRADSRQRGRRPSHAHHTVRRWHLAEFDPASPNGGARRFSTQWRRAGSGPDTPCVNAAGERTLEPVFQVADGWTGRSGSHRFGPTGGSARPLALRTVS